MKLPLKKPLNEKDSLAFLLHSSILRKGEDPRNHPIICRFCERVGIDRHDYAIAAQSDKWVAMLDVMTKRGLLQTS